MPSSEASAHPISLVVDLDGTLIKTDLLWEHLTRLLRRNPFSIFQILFWWTHGRARLKQELARRIQINASALPYNEKFLNWLREQKSSGRKIILATASDLQMAKPVADYVGIFDEVLASDGKTNLRSQNKLKLLVEKFEQRGFDYAGNSSADFAVWRGAREAIVVNASKRLANKAADCAHVGKIFEPETCLFHAFIRALRPHQWVKNLIIFAPIIAGHKLNEPLLLLRDVWAFVAFCLCASGVYLVNDLVDLDSDREHPGKKNRPFASGDLPLSYGLIVAPMLFAAGLWISTQLSWFFTIVILSYIALTTSYSWWVKRVALLDVFFLAGLYTMRLVAGSIATDIVNSSWLLMFSMFLFLSLALVKRYVELAAKELKPKQTAHGRGYVAGDLEVITSLGAGSGYLAALVLALYVDSDQVITLYVHPKVLLLICPLLLFWISRVWLLAHRGQMHDDPVVFALKDLTSYIIGILTFLILWLAMEPHNLQYQIP